MQSGVGKKVRLDSCPHASRHYLQLFMMRCRTRGPGLGTRAEMNMGLYIAKSAGFLSSRSGLLCSPLHVTPVSAARKSAGFLSSRSGLLCSVSHVTLESAALQLL